MFNNECDVAIIGGGPWGMLLGAMLAQRKYQVTVFDRNSGPGFESTWNLSRPEFEGFKSTGILPPQDFEDMAIGEYVEGIFSFIDKSASPPSPRVFHFDEILNVSVDECRFLSALSSTPGLNVNRGVFARLESLSSTAVFVGDSRGMVLKARLLIDASGWTSPLASLANPTREIESIYNMIGFRTTIKLPRPQNNGRPVGIIGATYEDEIMTAEGPVQPILERFTDFIPGGNDAGDVVYYFTRTSQPAPMAPMMGELLARTHQIIPGFREEMADRTYFGHMPAWRPLPAFSRFHRQISAGDRLLLAGASGFQYSGLTGCAFGSLARNAVTISGRISHALALDKLGFQYLNRIDIDPRERVSMDINGLFAGTMALGEGEGPGTVNRDWIAFSDAAEAMDQRLKNEAFRDKIRLATLNQLVSICAGRPRVILALLRNNRGHIGAVIWTFIASYVKLLMHEARLLASRRKGKYLLNGGMALMQLPEFGFKTAILWAKSRSMEKEGRLNKGGG